MNHKNPQDREKLVFLLILVLSFAAVLILNLFTPMLSDDYAYAMEVQKASSLCDLVVQEYHQYMTWNGRSVAHLLLRLFLFLPAPVFKIFNSLAFAALSYVMAQLACREKRYDCWTLLMVQMGLWLYAADFAETILWEDGACNYLWGALIIFTFLLAQRNALESGRLRIVRSRGRLALQGVLLFLFGVMAGWCNENTSGGCLLALLIWLAVWRRKGSHIPRPYIAGMVGNAVGLAVMVLSPGARLRASYDTDENYSGLLGLLARFQKITLTIREYYAILLAALLAAAVLLWFQRNKRGLEKTLLFGFLFLATSYALVATRQTQPRAFFGAGLFLMIGAVSGIREAMQHSAADAPQMEKQLPNSAEADGGMTSEGAHCGQGEERETNTVACAGREGYLLQAAGWSLLAVLLMQLLFTYADNATNVGRIWRDERNRIAYIKEQAAKGETQITVPMVHTDFYNDYSAIEKMEMTDDAGYWINLFYEEYYGVESIKAIPYDDWEALQGE